MMEWYNVGKVVNTHGVRGEIRVIPTTDFEEERFVKGEDIYLYRADTDSERHQVTIENVRYHKQFTLLTFSEISSLDEAEKWKNSLLQIPETKLQELDEGEYYYHEIIGCMVYSEEGDALGPVREILSPGANDVWVVEPYEGKNDILVPYIDDVVKKVDINNKTIVIHVMEGLMS
ncbi:ribosome maturation factor RimM [Salibacterium salarium]|uniref:Ribosome maturation factor RimM n=1 Tax=Salibacterium salarium TaxID=284579 RepID=A0A3R9WQ74_9BACI|nr:ribosome maturation factor RimM [Salibacterium salarium]RSL31253.1 ribosome maturation factor RimM [Salibacterium salarium]